MSLSAAWPAGTTRVLALRLLPGEDLRGALEAAFAASGATAGFVIAAVGSLGAAALRMAAQDRATDVPGPLEIVALSGTFSVAGPHLHVAVAGPDGRVTGGHLLHGCPVRTTCEVVLGLTGAVVFDRKQDTRTGWKELFIENPGSL